MFYWYEKTTGGTTLKEELLSSENVKEVKIATAFLSDVGVDIIKKMKLTYSLEKNKIFLYLSDRFSVDKPYKILQELMDVCTVKIISDYNFHPKVYLIKGKVDKIIYGSSNFTNGGMRGNIEFDFIGEMNDDDKNKIDLFFRRCDNISYELTDDIIEYYINNKAEFEELNKIQNRLSKKISEYRSGDDAFNENTYNIEKFYFDFNDYEVFFLKNQTKRTNEIRKRRENVQNKMLAIHKKIYSQIKKLGVSCHKDASHITSMIEPSQYNNYTISWLGVRYGKTPYELDIINSYLTEEYPFYRHGCLQYSISQYGFEINLFFAVKEKALDRMYLHEHLWELEDKIISELNALKGNGMEWVIWNDKTNTADTENYYGVKEFQYYRFAEFDSVNNKDRYRPSQIEAHSNNRDGMTLQITSELLLKRPEKTKLLIIISDGQPAADNYGGEAAKTVILFSEKRHS